MEEEGVEVRGVGQDEGMAVLATFNSRNCLLSHNGKFLCLERLTFLMGSTMKMLAMNMLAMNIITYVSKKCFGCRNHEFQTSCRNHETSAGYPELLVSCSK